MYILLETGCQDDIMPYSQISRLVTEIALSQLLPLLGSLVEDHQVVFEYRHIRTCANSLTAKYARSPQYAGRLNSRINVWRRLCDEFAESEIHNRHVRYSSLRALS